MHTTRKRKRQSDHTNKRNHHQNDWGDNRNYRTHQHQPDQDPNLFVQAHEADLRRGPQAQELAKSLEVVEHLDTPGQEAFKQRIGSALIQWAGGHDTINNPFDQDEETISLGSQKAVKDKVDIPDDSGIWVDRYDVRLLLDTLPDFASPGPTAPSSPSGWSDLPSDTEETFFFSPEEAEDFRNEKRRRLFEKAHEERVKARQKEEEEENEETVNDDPWGGSDEEPDESQKELMRRTAVHLLSTPNAAQLEMRILANHGADKRFAFLRGRWNRSWRLIKAKLRVETEQKERKDKQEKEQKGLGVLSGYDSGSEGDTDREREEQTSKMEERVTEQDDDEVKKETRRQKAKEWAEKRRLAMAGIEGEQEA